MDHDVAKDGVDRKALRPNAGDNKTHSPKLSIAALASYTPPNLFTLGAPIAHAAMFGKRPWADHSTLSPLPIDSHAI